MEKILLIEDDTALAVGLKYSMEKENFSVVTAGGVKEGYEKFQNGTFSLVVLDIGLPDGTGFELCKMIREVSAVPILFLTACDEETNVVMGLDMGGDEYITKPFRLRELISRIKAFLRRAGGKSNEKIESLGFVLHAEECRLLKGETEIPLTPAECRLVYLLMSNPGRALTRSQLLSKLWDSGGDFVAENTLMYAANTQVFVDMYTTEKVFNSINSNKPSLVTLNLKRGADSDIVFSELKELTNDNKNLKVYNQAEGQDVSKRIVLVVDVFVYGFTAIIALIGILNILNTMSTSIITRTREMGLLRASGMTMGQVTAMIACESALYGLLALIIGLAGGIPLYCCFFNLLIKRNCGIPWYLVIASSIITGRCRHDSIISPALTH